MSPKNTKIIPLVEIKNFSKRYGKHVVLDYTSFQIMPGERLSIIGPNGAGKTTLAKIVAGTEKTTAGKIKRSIPLSEIGSQYQNSTFPDGYTAEELVYYYSSIVQKENKINDVENMLKVFGFDNIRHHKANILSFGQKQKLNILISLLSQPKLLILDEFTNGLDVLSEKSIVDFLTEYIKRHNIAILLITHNMADAVKFSDKIVLVNDQKIKLIANSEDVTMSKNIVKEFASFIKTDEEKVQISPTFGMKSDRILSSSDKFYKNMTKYMSAQGSNLIDSKTEACKLIEVTKTYGKKQVLKGINLSLPYDATMAIVGPNGAGKSTLIELIALTKRQTTGYIG
ncbi:MAG: hypothetical protein DRP42_00855 [Tenericutes bacterium]|nr:MAG: hypothetical protein DRP42_00855 [Mycoplasmatota bacterium]